MISNTDFPNAPQIISPNNMIHFGKNNFTVTLEWSECSGESYSFATVPEPAAVHMMSLSSLMSTRVQLVLLYDTEYNVTVTATLCGDSNATNSTTLSYYHSKKNIIIIRYYVLLSRVIIL